MGNHPLNLLLRFVLELVALYAMGYWGWNRSSGWLRFVLALGLPLLAAALWGTFRVPGDPGNAPVPVAGAVRLALEAAFFGAAVIAFYAAGQVTWAWVFGVTVFLHYLISYDRIAWLLSQ